ncbi:hypothetical protein IFM89_010044 [Coptis chinensis]|uniref:ABC transporter domain-containing protein n=1 Tax=Coptis chinensis TaxID=261450 RepID=A0A835HM53_9MAGN|nr:hypothetical protein IFM89_010044 [Coptis chinensis]
MGVLARRKTGGYIDGTITISGYPKNRGNLCSNFETLVSGQISTLELNVTVHESLVYSAWLRLPHEVDLATRKMFIEEGMELVELKSLSRSTSRVARSEWALNERISQKRLTIAVELVANPSIIFMDEPTSGLDAERLLL